MKHLLLVFAGWFITVVPAFSSDSADVIPIYQRPSSSNDFPRTESPFFAEYNETLSAVMLGCNDSIGDVTVTLESTAGDWYQTVFDTSDGAILVPTSGLTGHYVLTIETADHTVYEGEFYL